MNIHILPTGFGLSFLLEYPHGLYLIDTGHPGQQGAVLEKMRALGRSDLRLIWITHAHYDHYGSAAALRRLTGAPIGVHPADAPHLAAGRSPLGTARRHGWVFRLVMPLLNRLWPLPPAAPDFTRGDGETLAEFGLQAAVLHTPGHTPGHTCLLLDGAVAFAADLISRAPARLQDLLATGWEQLPGSLARLQAARPEWVYTGHSRRPLAGSELQSLAPRPGR